MDGEEDSYCDFEIIFSVILDSSHYAKPRRRTQQQAHLYQVIIISFPCSANNHCLHSLHYQHSIIVIQELDDFDLQVQSTKLVREAWENLANSGQ